MQVLAKHIDTQHLAKKKKKKKRFGISYKLREINEKVSQLNVSQLYDNNNNNNSASKTLLTSFSWSCICIGICICHGICICICICLCTLSWFSFQVACGKGLRGHSLKMIYVRCQFWKLFISFYSLFMLFY